MSVFKINSFFFDNEFIVFNVFFQYIGLCKGISSTYLGLPNILFSEKKAYPVIYLNWF